MMPHGGRSTVDPRPIPGVRVRCGAPPQNAVVDDPSVPRIVQRSGVSPGSVGKTGTLGSTVNDLAHALFATGRAPGDQARFGDASFWEFVHRASLIPASVRINSSGRLVKSALALELDRSEKVALSYALG